MSGPKSIKVTYTGGYLTGDGIGTPDDVRVAAIEQTKIIFDRREEFGLSGRSLEGGARTPPRALAAGRGAGLVAS